MRGVKVEKEIPPYTAKVGVTSCYLPLLLSNGGKEHGLFPALVDFACTEAGGAGDGVGVKVDGAIAARRIEGQRVQIVLFEEVVALL